MLHFVVRAFSLHVNSRLESLHHNLEKNPAVSGEDLLDDIAVDIRKPKVAPLGTEGELRVLEAEAVEDRGLKVVNVHAIFGDAVAHFVGRAVRDAGLDAAAGHPG